jgi:hypothetical protein
MATVIISPWAKLMIRTTPKMQEEPSAIRPTRAGGRIPRSQR